MTVRTGDPAPSFTLPDRPGHDVDVDPGAAGRPVVLLFFPLAFSSVCTREMCRIKDEWEAWRDLDADVYAISVDSPFVTEKFRAENDLPFPVLSDFNRDVAADYGVLYEEYYGLEGVARRSVFVIGDRGEVVYDWVTEDSENEPDYATVREAVSRSRGGAS